MHLFIMHFSPPSVLSALIFGVLSAPCYRTSLAFHSSFECGNLMSEFAATYKLQVQPTIREGNIAHTDFVIFSPNQSTGGDIVGSCRNILKRINLILGNVHRLLFCTMPKSLLNTCVILQDIDYKIVAKLVGV